MAVQSIASKKRINFGCSAILLLLVIAGAFLWLTPKKVFLKADPIRHEVQMFERVGTGPNDIVYFFPDRTACTVITERASYDVAGSLLEFYKLDCNGKVGYVNARWVSRF